MLTFDELKDKVLATAGTVADKSIEVAKFAGDKAKIVAKITRLNAELAGEKETLRRTYQEMGKRYYELHRTAPEENMAQAVADAEHSLEKIEAKRQQISDLRTELRSSGDDYEDYMDDDIDDLDDLEPDEPESKSEDEEPKS